MKRFIIATVNRSGFHYLQSLIQQHHQMMCCGELWNFLNIHGPKWIGIEETIKPEEPIDEYLEKLYQQAESLGYGACGFKVSCGEMRNWLHMPPPLAWLHVWHYLKNQQVSVVNLIRRESFGRYLSNSLAFHEKNFKMDPYESKIKIDFKDYIDLEKKIDAHRSDVKEHLSNCPQMDIYYEDLCDNQTYQLNRVCEFLEMEPYREEVISETNKQLQRDPKDYIENYDALLHEAKRQIERGSECKYMESFLRVTTASTEQVAFL